MDGGKPDAELIVQETDQLDPSPSPDLPRGCEHNCATLTPSVDVTLDIALQVGACTFLHGGDEEEWGPVRKLPNSVHPRIVATLDRAKRGVVVSQEIDGALLERCAVERAGDCVANRAMQGVWHASAP